MEEFAFNVSENTKTLSVTDFENFLIQPSTYMNTSLMKIFADLLTSGQAHSKEQKKLVAVSIRLVFLKRISTASKQQIQSVILTCWQQYYEFILLNQDMQWKYTYLTINALKYILHEMQGQVNNHVINKFNSQLSFFGKLMLYEGICRHENISIDNQLIFFKQTYRNYLSIGCQFIDRMQSNSSKIPQDFQIEKIFIQLLHEWLQLIFQQRIAQLQQKQNDLKDMLYLLRDLSQDNLIYEIITKQLVYDYHNFNTNINFNNVQQVASNARLLKAGDNENDIDIRTHNFRLKSYILSIIELFLTPFKFDSSMEEFDHVKILGLMEQLAPLIIFELKESVEMHKQKVINNNNNHIHPSWMQDEYMGSIIIEMLKILKEASRFMFMMQIFQEHKITNLYLIIPHFIQIHLEQQEKFQDSSQEFIAIQQNFLEIEKYTQPTTVKQSAGNFLSNVLKLLNGVEKQYITVISDGLFGQLTNQNVESLSSFFSSNNLELPTIQTLLTLVSKLYMETDHSSKTIMDLFYDKFIRPDYFLTELQSPILISRYIMFITYVFAHYFKSENAFQQGQKFLAYAFDNKSKHPVLLENYVELVNNALQFGLSQDLWNNLMSNIINTKVKDQISLVKTLIEYKLHDLSQDHLIQLINKIVERVRIEFQEGGDKIRKGYGSHILYKCLQTLDLISYSYKQLSTNEQVKQALFKIFNDFLTNPEILSGLQFDKQLISIFNNIMSSYPNDEPLPSYYLSILPVLKQIVYKNRQIAYLVETYYLILLKGKSLFENEPKYLEQIQVDIEEYILIRNETRTLRLVVQALFLLQNILLVYPNLIKENKNVFRQCAELYKQQKISKAQQLENTDDQIIASVLLYWMVRQRTFGCRQHQQSPDSFEDNNKQNELPGLFELIQAIQGNKIQIFNEQFGLMLALNIHKLIQKQCLYHINSNQNNSGKHIEHLLKIGLKLLDYQNDYKSKVQYQSPKFTIKVFQNLLILDSFQQIYEALMFLKDNLRNASNGQPEFNYYADKIISQIGSNSAIKLFNTRIFENKKQREIITVDRKSY